MEAYAQRTVLTSGERLEWFRAAKFGMFIHWGLYAKLAGSWNGEEVADIGEQIMRFGKIPVDAYREIAREFNPVRFDAERWVSLAREAGMRYIVITAKHHDGFAMYHSKCSPYNIVDATPFGRDPMKELAAACQRQGMKLCFYYSHVQDWDDPDGFTKGGHWDASIPPVEDQAFERYMDRKAILQVAELLTGYGPIGLLWYDTPGDLSDYNATRFENLVHAIQPECIVGPRVSSNPDIGDYIGYGDNQVPTQANTRPWETCATMNDTWGFKAQDHNWKPVDRLLRLLVSIVSKGGNYLLNVGPTAEGEIPGESVIRLRDMGKWLSGNGEAVYGTSGCLLKQAPEWGAVTGAEGKLYLHLFDWVPGEFILTGLQNKVRAVKCLASGEALAFSQHTHSGPNIEVLSIALPENAPDTYVSVLALDIEGMPVFDETPCDIDGEVFLSGFCARIESSKGKPHLAMNAAGILENWHDTGDWLSWEMNVTQPGKFEVVLNTFTERYPERNPEHWEGGHAFTFEVGDESLDFVVTEGERTYPRDNYQWQNIATPCGSIAVHKAGRYTATLRANKLVYDKGFGPKVRGVVLRRV